MQGCVLSDMVVCLMFALVFHSAYKYAGGAVPMLKAGLKYPYRGWRIAKLQLCMSDRQGLSGENGLFSGGSSLCWAADCEEGSAEVAGKLWSQLRDIL